MPSGAAQQEESPQAGHAGVSGDARRSHSRCACESRRPGDFINGTTACQSAGLQVYRGAPVTLVCAGRYVAAAVISGDDSGSRPARLLRRLPPGDVDSIIVAPI